MVIFSEVQPVMLVYMIYVTPIIRYIYHKLGHHFVRVVFFFFGNVMEKTLRSNCSTKVQSYVFYVHPWPTELMKNKWNTMERDWWKYWFSTLLQCHSRVQPACERWDSASLFFYSLGHFLYYKAWTKYLPVLLRTAKLAQSPSQYHFVLQSLHKVFPKQDNLDNLGWTSKIIKSPAQRHLTYN